jgi:tripartite-type tricarboxylate transporter receptor subunit TctC
MNHFIRVLAGLCLAAVYAAAHAQYPAKPISLVVPFPPGATTDTIARVLAQHVSASIGKPVVVDNRPGAEGQLAAQEIRKAAPDGYKIGLATSGNLSVLPALRKDPPYDSAADFTPIADVGRYAFFFYVHPSVPAKTFREFVDYAKANPGKLSYGTGNNTGVLTMGQFKAQFGLDMLHVPYKGEPPAIVDLVAGRTQAMVGTSIGIPHVKEGKLRMLLQLLPRRSGLAPDVPVLTELGMKDLPVVLWAALIGPAGMPRDVVERLNKEFNAAMARPEVQAQMDQIGFALTPAKPEALAALIRDQARAYKDLVKAVGLPQE